MRFSHDIYRTHREHITDHGIAAPTAFAVALQSLAAGQPPNASLMARSSTANETTWKAFWLTGTNLVYAEATAAHEDWNGGDDTDDVLDATVTGWVRPVLDIRSFEISGQKTWRDDVNRQSVGASDWVLNFPDAKVPLFSPTGSGSLGDFVLSLRQAWIREEQ
ncbi:hypothetical protein [Rhodococcus erythropolis]|uniref:hypothetical protein n=1 Tax=Rhodococcus erythropolis TaxID=1833 RepID=UPI00382D2B0C